MPSSPPQQPTLLLRSSTPLPRSPSLGSGKDSDDANSMGPRTFVFSLQHRPRATRASVPKVRSGCITCKQVPLLILHQLALTFARRRHVKCDETKPACKRCLKSLNTCEGYATLSPNRAQAQSKRNSRSKSPASSQADTDRSPSATPSQQSEYPSPEGQAIPEPPIHDPIDDGWEEQYFAQWLVLAENLGGSWFPVALFRQTIPQLCRSEPAIRYAAIAVGALASAVAPSTVPGLSSGPSPAEGIHQHYNNAVTYHGHALRLVRVGLQGDASSDCTLRVAVISCLLFACFELLHDSPDEALNHINHGLTIIDQFMYTPQTTYLSVSPAPSPTNTGPNHQRQGSPSDKLANSPKSPVPFVLDGEILDIFRRLEYLSWCARIMQNLPTPPSAFHFLCPLETQDPATAFNDLVEARRSLDQVQHQTMRDLSSSEQGGLGSKSPIPSPSDLLSRWYWSFLPLFEIACANRELSDASTAYHQAVAMMLQYHSSSACLLLATSSLGHTSSAGVDGHLVDDSSELIAGHFQEILNLAPILLHNQQWPAGTTAMFTMDQGPTMGLSLVASHAMDERMGPEARRLLTLSRRRDAFWGARFKVGQEDT